jgi:hypothetical protein
MEDDAARLTGGGKGGDARRTRSSGVEVSRAVANLQSPPVSEEIVFSA